MKLISQNIIRGDTLKDPVMVITQDGIIPVDLTGVTAKMMIRSKNNTLVHDASSSIVITPLAGRVAFNVPNTVTELWSLGKKYYYDIELTCPADLENPGGSVVTLLQTELTVVKDYTHS